MKIETGASITPTAAIRTASRTTAPQAPARPLDQQDVSSGALMLAKNQQQLSEQLASRSSVIQRFARHLNDPVVLHDRTLDRIIHNLKFT